MKSHVCNFNSRDLISLLALPLVPVLLFVAAMHCGAKFGLLPAPRPALDVDRTIVIHQAAASRRPQNAAVLLLGDSSCLMDINARQLGDEMGVPALNLGTLSFLDLDNYSALLRQYVAANPGRLRTVVLLMNPESLRRVSAEDYYLNVLNSFWEGRDFCRTTSMDDRMACALGLEILRGRILSRALPIPLAGAFGRHYGFTRNLEASMTRERGSVVDPATEKPKGRPEYRLAPTLHPASQRFKAAVPPGVKICAGITPVPEKFAGAGYPALRADMLRQWGEWLKADAVLQELPATLPEEQFARPTHLNAAYVPRYTGELAQTLKRILP